MVCGGDEEEDDEAKVYNSRLLYFIPFSQKFLCFLVCLLDEGIKAVVVFVMNFQTFCLGGTVVHII